MWTAADRPPPDEVGLAVDLDTSPPIHLSDPRDSPSCHRKMEMAAWISVALEAETFRHMPNLCPLPIPKDSWEAGYKKFTML